MSIDAISGGGYRGSAWDRYQDLKASPPDAGSQGSVTALTSSTTASSAADATSGQAGGADSFSRLLDDMRTLATDSASASGSASGRIANAGTALSFGGTLPTTLLADLSAIAKDLTGIFNGQNAVTSTEAASTDTSVDAPTVSGPSTNGDGSGIAGHRHHGRHGSQAFLPVPGQPLEQGVTLASATNAEIGQLVAKTASPG